MFPNPAEDGTIQVQAEDALQSVEEHVHLILSSATEGIFGCDPEGTCLFSNASAARMLGYSDPRELLAKNMHALEHHTRKDGTPYPLEECPIYVGFQKGESVHRDDEVFWRKDGTSFPVEYWSNLVVREGETKGAVITFIDITGRKRTEEVLRKSEERNRSLLEINNAIITNLSQEALLRSISEALHRVIAFDRCAITLYQADHDSFLFLAVEGELSSDYFRTGLEIPGARPASAGCLTIGSRYCVAIFKQNVSMPTNAASALRESSHCAWCRWLFRESVSGHSV